MPRVTFTRGEKFERVMKDLIDPGVALKQIGILLVAESQRAFKMQQHGDKPWDARAPVNIFGIISDFAQGKAKPAARRFETRPALRDTGRLASSIAFQVTGNTVEWGTTVEYAAVHQHGGETKSEKMTGTVRRKLWKWLKRQDTEMKRRVGWVLNAKFRDESITQNVPARPFLGITPATRKAVAKMIGVEIMETK